MCLIQPAGETWKQSGTAYTNENLLFSASKKDFSISKSTFAQSSSWHIFEDRGRFISILLIEFFSTYKHMLVSLLFVCFGQTFALK